MSRHSANRISGGNGMELKVVVLGDQAVGKTSLVLRYIHGYFTPMQTSTVGAFFLTKKVTLEGGNTIKMNLWDTAGQEKFRSMAPMYYRNADAAVICFDVCEEASFVKMKDWIDELRRSNVSEEKLVLAIVANKVDRPAEERQVSRSRSEDFASQVGALHIETSAKDDVGVKELFSAVSQKMWDLKSLTSVLVSPVAATNGGAITIHPAPSEVGVTGTGKKKGCC